MQTDHRAALQARHDALHLAVTTYFAEAHESLQDFKRQITNHLDDVRMLLGWKSVQTDYFVPLAEMTLGMAERQFQSSKELIEKYGGPRKARLVG